MVQRQRGFSERREGGEPPAEKLARKRLGTQAGVRREVQRVYAQVDQGLITGMEAVRRVRVCGFRFNPARFSDVKPATVPE